jgi:NADH-quinone oxidoreductase subunit J
MSAILFILFAGMAIGCAVSVVIQRNPLYSAISLIGVFVSLACLYVTLAAPFIAAVQVIVYAGAIMVLVVFVIMLLNVEEEERPKFKLGYLAPVAVLFAAFLVAEASFFIFTVQSSQSHPSASANPSNVGITSSIGAGLFTQYLLPFEITSILLLMAIVGAMSLARRVATLSPTARIVPGVQVLTAHTAGTDLSGEGIEVETDSTSESARLLGLEGAPRSRD